MSTKQTAEQAAKLHIGFPRDPLVAISAYDKGFVDGSIFGSAWQREQGIEWISVAEKGLPPCTIFGSYHKDSVEVLVTDGERFDKAHYHESITLQGWFGTNLNPTHWAYINLPKTDKP